MQDCRWARWGIVAMACVLMGQAVPSRGDDGSALKALADHWADIKDVRTLEARFICEKQLAALETPLHSEGHLWIGKNKNGKADGADGVRFFTDKPYVSELILTGGKVFARSQHETEWTKTNQSTRPGLTAVMGQLGGWSTGDSTKIADMYAVTKSAEHVPAAPGSKGDAEEALADIFVLTPTNADMAKAVKRLMLALDHKSGFLRYIEITTQQDDATRYWFLDVKANGALPVDVFKAAELVAPGEGK